MFRYKTWVLAGSLIVILAACQAAGVEETPTVELQPTQIMAVTETEPLPSSPVATHTVTRRPAATSTVTSTVRPAAAVLTATPSITPTEILPKVRVRVLSIMLRSGPGTVHQVLDTFSEGSELVMLGRAVGDEWVQVLSDEGLIGWMYADYLYLPAEVEDLPYQIEEQSWAVNGRVVDDLGQPLADIAVALVQGSGVDEQRTNAHSDQEGHFYLYLPWEVGGIWNVSVTGVGCESAVVNSNCRLMDYFLYRPDMNVRVPGDTPIILIFAHATSRVDGMVLAGGEGVAAIAVRAVELGGARSWTSSAPDGSFSLPIGPGTWTLTAHDETSGCEAEPVTIAIGAGQVLQNVIFNLE